MIEPSRSEPRLLRRSDLIVIAAILLAALAISLIWSRVNRADVVYAEVYYDNDLIETIPMIEGEEQAFTFVQEDSIVITRYDDGSVAFTQSDCPDKVCIHAGPQSQPYQFAACLPNRFLLNIVGENGDEAEVDFVN